MDERSNNVSNEILDSREESYIRGSESGLLPPPQMPAEMQFNDGHLLSIVLYSILMTFSALANITGLISIMK
jgi:hypothetical protein